MPKVQSHVHRSIVHRTEPDAFALWPDVDAFSRSAMIAFIRREPVVLFEGAGEGGSGGGSGGEGGSKGGEGGGEGGSKEGGSKTFSQEDVERIVSGRVNKIAKERDDLKSKLDSLAKDLEALKKGGSNDDDDSKASPTAKLTRQVERLTADLEASKKQLEGLTGERDGALAKYRDHVAGQRLTEALLAAGASPKSVRHAAQVFRLESGLAVEESDDGKLAIVATIGGVPFTDTDGKDLVSAAKRWLASDGAHFMPAPTGAGTKNGGGAGFRPDELAKLDETDAIAIGLGKK